MSNLLVQSFGKESEYRRAVLTILSFFTFVDPKANVNVFVFTDNPDWFNLYFSELPVTYILLTPERIREMRGEIDFLHRMKIALIEEGFKLSKGNIIYSDSDAFFISNPLPLIEGLTADKSYMHLMEYEFGSLSTKTSTGISKQISFRQLIESKQFKISEDPKFGISLSHSSWNAGIMIFHCEHVNLLPDVYALTEQIYPLTLNHASEQYAFSVILQTKTKLDACEHLAYHYWYRVEKQVADLYLQKKVTLDWAKKPLTDKLSEVGDWRNELRSLFRKHVLILKDNAIQAFNNNKVFSGYKWSLQAFLKGAYQDRMFVKDILYHTKRTLLTK